MLFAGIQFYKVLDPGQKHAGVTGWGISYKIRGTSSRTGQPRYNTFSRHFGAKQGRIQLPSLLWTGRAEPLREIAVSLFIADGLW